MAYEAQLQRQIDDLKREMDRLKTVEKSMYRAEVSIASNGTSTPFGTLVMRGVLFVISAEDGIIAIYRWEGGGTVLVSGDAAYWSVTAATASKHNVYLDGSGYLTIENKRGATRSMRMAFLRL